MPKINVSHVEKAFSIIREKGYLPNGPSTKWDVLDPKTNERFPPKAVLRIAKELAEDSSPPVGGGWPTNNPLLELGFEIALKPDQEHSNEVSDIESIVTSSLDETTKKRLVNARLGQGGFREALLEIWDEKCPVTDCDIEAVLRASHIKPWRDSNNQERLDPNNGILLAASIDALFDKHLITFTNSGRIRANSKISASAFNKLGVFTGAKILIKAPMTHYLDAHRAEFDRVSEGHSFEV